MFTTRCGPTSAPPAGLGGTQVGREAGQLCLSLLHVALACISLLQLKRVAGTVCGPHTAIAPVALPLPIFSSLLHRCHPPPSCPCSCLLLRQGGVEPRRQPHHLRLHRPLSLHLGGGLGVAAVVSLSVQQLASPPCAACWYGVVTQAACSWLQLQCATFPSQAEHRPAAPSPLTGGCPRRRLAVRAAGPPGRGDCGGLVPLRFPAGPRLGCV